MRSQARLKLLVLKNDHGHPLRLIQTETNSICVVQNCATKRIELVHPKADYKKTHTLIQEVNLNKEDGDIRVKNIGVISIHQSDQSAPLDPSPLKDNEPHFPQLMKWSSASHGAVIAILILFGLLISPPTPQKILNEENLVTIHLDQPVPEKLPQPPVAPQPVVQRKPVVSQKVATVVPRIHKNKPLLVKKAMIAPKRTRMAKTTAPVTFQRLGSLGAISNALKGSRSGIGSGLRGPGGGTGGVGRGAGLGRGNGTMGHGHDSGGGYEQALYGKGLIAGQVGAGGGGFGSGWGEGSRGSGGFGTKGKGGGHQGYGNSKIGSGASRFSYPVREDAVVEGGLDRESVDLVVMKNLGQIIYCYEIGLQQKASLRGRVLMDFIINGQGRVSSCSVSNSSLHSSQVENCIVSKIRTWKFPHPAGGVNVEVSYPFALQRVSQN